MNNKGKYTDIIIFAALLVVVLSVMTYVLYGQINRLVKTNAESESIGAMIKKDQMTFDTLIKIKSELPIYQRQLTYLNKLMPEKLNEASISEYLLKIAQKGNARISEMKFADPVSKSGYSERLVSFTMNSGFNGLLMFLDKLQNGEKLVLIDKVDITDNSDPDITTAITVRMFYLEK